MGIIPKHEKITYYSYNDLFSQLSSYIISNNGTALHVLNSTVEVLQDLQKCYTLYVWLGMTKPRSIRCTHIPMEEKKTKKKQVSLITCLTNQKKVGTNYYTRAVLKVCCESNRSAKF